MTVELRRRLFTVKEYYRMAAAGILQEDDRVELIEGEIVENTPISSRHAWVVDRICAFFSRSLSDDQSVVRGQNPIRLSDLSEPQPDVVLARPPRDAYLSGHPRSGEVLLLVEVSDTSLEYDREVKLPLYGREGIPEVWIVDLSAESVEVFRQPSTGEYSASLTVRRGGAVSPLAFPDLRVAVDDILG